MSVIGSNILAGSSGQGGGAGYAIDRSLRFNSSDNASLTKALSSDGNIKKWTWSGWIKRGKLGVNQEFFGVDTGTSAQHLIKFDSSDRIHFYRYASGYHFRRQTTQVFRDPSAWYHLVVVWDTDNSTAADRAILYVNGVRITSYTSSTDPTSGETGYINDATYTQGIGVAPSVSTEFDGYLADIHFIDGQALSATDFGEYDDNNVWQPKEYAGTYGTNGFHLDFSDNSSNAALGTDTSGNGNDWTPVNLSVTQSTGDYNGSLTTSLGSIVDYTLSFNGNLATNNARGNTSLGSAGASATISFTPATPIAAASLRVYASFGNTAYVRQEISVNGGTYQLGGGAYAAGWYDLSAFVTGGSISSLTTKTTRVSSAVFPPFFVDAIEVNGVILIDYRLEAGNDSLVDSPTNGTQTDTGVGGEVVGNYATLNPLDNGGLTLSNGNLQFDRATASWISGRATIGMSSGKWYWEVVQTTGTSMMVGISKGDASQSSYVGAVATGWAYNSGDGNKYNSAINSAYGNTYTTNDIIGVAFDADSGNLKFYKNGTVQNSGTAAYTGLTSGPYFPAVSLYGTATAFTNFGQRAFHTAVPSGYKALCTANLDDPTIPDGSKYFDTKLWTGDGTGSRSFTGYAFSPDFAWVKSRSLAYTHVLWDAVRGAGVSKELQSDSTNAEGGASTNASGYLSAFNSDGFSSTAGTSDNDYFNKSGQTYAAWAWDAGTASSNTTIAAGSLNSSLYDQSDAWISRVTGTPFSGYSIATMFDGSASALLYANTGSSLTFTPTTPITVTSSIRIYGAQSSSTEFIKINDNAATNVPFNAGWFTPNTGTAITSLSKLEFYTTNGSYASGVGAIEIDGKILVDSGVSITTPSIASEYRANPSAGFSIVKYSGTGVGGDVQTIGHGLSAPPKFVICKNLDASGSWHVGHEGAGWTTGAYLQLTDGFASSTNTRWWNSTEPDSSVVTLGQYPLAGAGEDHIAYCFAPVEGYSAIGSYEGNGSTDGTFVYTGFRPRFVMIKSIDNSRNWNIHDTARNPENDGNTAKLYPNLSNQELDDAEGQLDILSNGFKLKGNWLLNNVAETYIYAAFAEHPFKTSRAR